MYKNKYNISQIDIKYKIILNNTISIKLYISYYFKDIKKEILKKLEKIKKVNFIKLSISFFTILIVYINKKYNIYKLLFISNIY